MFDFVIICEIVVKCSPENGIGMKWMQASRIFLNDSNCIKTKALLKKTGFGFNIFFIKC